MRVCRGGSARGVVGSEPLPAVPAGGGVTAACMSTGNAAIQEHMRSHLRDQDIHGTHVLLHGAEVVFAEPQPRTGAGQACVVYDQPMRLCLGGDWIA